MTDIQDYAHHLKGLSPIGLAAARFAIEKPGLSMPQKDRVAAAIGVLDKMNCLERDVVRALVTEAKSEWPDVPPSMPPGTQPDVWSGHRSTIDLQRRRQIDAGTGGLE